MIGDEIDHPHWHGDTECDARVRRTGQARPFVFTGICTETQEEVEPWER